MSSDKLVRVNTKHNMLWTVQQIVDGVRGGYVFANERIAIEVIPALVGHEVRIETLYVKTKRGAMRQVAVVDLGILVEEFSSWKEAILFYAN